MRPANSVTIIIIMAIVLSCAGVVRVSDIRERPSEFHDQRITLSGHVEEVITMPILGIGVYELNDGTGNIWVKPEGRTPRKGDKVKVTGEVKVGLMVSGQSFGIILIEKEDPDQ
jgi:hypothetical protein